MINFPAHLSPEQFLSRHWQRQPLLMRGALNGSGDIISPDELAGLACEADAESRIIIHHPDDSWALEHGPIAAERFQNLPERDWTLLVQDVDKFVPAARDLLREFDFLPHWRLDDVMVSYAVDGGGVGPHLDGYDVFLCQAQGQRRWRLGDPAAAREDERDELPLRLLQHFEPTQDWLLGPGDVLYLPPGVPHWGTAVGECLTLSVGFRGPDRHELLQDLLEQLVSDATPARPFRDPPLTPHSSRGALPQSLFDQVRAVLEQALAEQDMPALLGPLFTRPKPQFVPAPPAQIPLSPAQARLKLHPWVRLAWLAPEGGKTTVFINGDTRSASASFAPTLRRLVAGQALMPEHWPDTAQDRHLVNAWVRQGLLIAEEESDAH